MFFRRIPDIGNLSTFPLPSGRDILMGRSGRLRQFTGIASRSTGSIGARAIFHMI
jgi:hypothetical protein